MKETLHQKILDRSAHVCVIGLGYVGLPLAVAFAKAGFHVTGLDVDDRKVKKLKEGNSYIQDIPSSELRSVLAKSDIEKGLHVSSDFSVLSKMDTVSICVPTPLNKTKDPDISYILSVRDQLQPHLHENMLIVLESTTYPGTTEEIFGPLIQSTALSLGQNIFIAFSPERIDPGNEKYTLQNTPKVIGGMTQTCSDIAQKLYSQIVDTVVPVSTARSAEMVKILENTFRAVNIALVNEVSIMCKILGIDTWEVIDAAATKPFGFTPFYPGPGLGGHCIPVDPHYLSWKLKTLNYRARFIDLASEVNTSMPHHVVHLVSESLNSKKKSVNGSKILLLGMAYKPNIDDVRESPAIDIFQLLMEKGANVAYHDPFVPSLRIQDDVFESEKYSKELLQKQDAVVITTNHRFYQANEIVECSSLVIDTRNLTKGLQLPKVVKL